MGARVGGNGNGNGINDLTAAASRAGGDVDPSDLPGQLKDWPPAER